MIFKEVLHVTNEITKFGANHVSVSVFASIVYCTIKDMQMYCLDSELKEVPKWPELLKLKKKEEYKKHYKP